jgi:hypothetical protein
MSKRIKHITGILVLSCLFQFSYSQSVYVGATIDRDQILIGEPIHLKLEVSLPVGNNATWFPLDTIPHFDFIEVGKIDTVSTQLQNTYNQVVTITSFDSGRWVIPPIALELNGRSYLTDSLPVSVTFSEFDASKDYHDIKDILTVENPSLSYINWILAAITLLSLVALVYFLRKRKQATPVPVVQTETRYSPYEQALLSLNELQARQLPEKGQVKTFYTGLNDILRLFITRKLALSTMQKTSEELFLQVKDLGLPHDDFIAMVQTLRMSDAVKFAKYVPGNADNEESFRNIRKSIELLNNLKT